VGLPNFFLTSETACLPSPPVGLLPWIADLAKSASVVMNTANPAPPSTEPNGSVGHILFDLSRLMPSRIQSKRTVGSLGRQCRRPVSGRAGSRAGGDGDGASFHGGMVHRRCRSSTVFMKTAGDAAPVSHPVSSLNVDIRLMRLPAP